ncbi:ankyrin repeat and KH domain-containing protein 1-like [Penaeus monodon]|uniref:ankyrin repeat and KH domain-containing protein 1-like n=1 Tax=Penaeus monodon TaxID=6687 RepID=UPI0018A745FC|nr:ankyrin repeat and KH domain-containing protein 1-like [Penaeus monodon]
MKHLQFPYMMSATAILFCRPSSNVTNAAYITKKKTGRATKPIPDKDLRLDRVGHFPIISEKRGSCKLPGCTGKVKKKGQENSPIASGTVVIFRGKSASVFAGKQASRMTSLNVQLILLCLLWHRATATIQESAAAGNINQVQTFLDNGVSIDNVAQGRTALTAAVENNQYAMVEFLLDAGANIDLPRTNGRTPIMLASINGFYDIAVLLIERGANLELEAGGQTAYSFAVTNNFATIACYLQESGASTAGVNEGSISGKCASGEIEYNTGDNWCENGTAVTCAGTCDTQSLNVSCEALTSTVQSTVMTTSTGEATTTVAAITTTAANTFMTISTLTPPATVTTSTTEFQPPVTAHYVR